MSSFGDVQKVQKKFKKSSFFYDITAFTVIFSLIFISTIFVEKGWKRCGNYVEQMLKKS